MDESTNQTPVSPATFDPLAYEATLSMVRKRLVIIEKSTEELSKLKEMLESPYLNDPAYQVAEAAVKEVQLKKKEVQNKLVKTPQVLNVMSKIKELKDEIRENKESLSDELMQYYQTAGVTEIEDEDGNVQEFEIVVKLKKKRSA